MCPCRALLLQCSWHGKGCSNLLSYPYFLQLIWLNFSLKGVAQSYNVHLSQIYAFTKTLPNKGGEPMSDSDICGLLWCICNNNTKRTKRTGRSKGCWVFRQERLILKILLLKRVLVSFADLDISKLQWPKDCVILENFLGSCNFFLSTQGKCCLNFAKMKNVSIPYTITVLDINLS